MDTTTVLVLDNNPTSLEIIERTLQEARIEFVSCDDAAAAWNIVRTNPDVTSLVTRMQTNGMDGCELTRQIRQIKSHDEFSILMIVAESELEIAAQAIDAGATDVLIDPFEAREFRMRMNIQPAWHRRRVDAPHPVASSGDDSAKDIVTLEEVTEETSTAPRIDVRTLLPTFNPGNLRFSHDVSEEQVEEWMDDPSVTKLNLDEVMVCPCCGCLPSFRYGCGACGSATTMPESLIHHYACAHISSEADFQHNASLRCPKCLKSNLVAGSDFEVVPGGHVCTECHAKVTEPELIGHCLSCQHRFAATDAVVQKLTGFRITRVHEAPKSKEHPFRPVKRRQSRQRELHSK